LIYPSGICKDSQGRIIVADTGNNRILRFTLGHTDGELIGGGFGEGNAKNQLRHPQGVCVDR